MKEREKERANLDKGIAHSFITSHPILPTLFTPFSLPFPILHFLHQRVPQIERESRARNIAQGFGAFVQPNKFSLLPLPLLSFAEK
ncbi:hypothetical protein VNO77_04984 [Canavalia gladiata]|uniref:Uncharacterized protein n=1 Tax=Canavalia gladiata TaxID=3824 RepID=A0AAN9MXH8_CANGL